MHLPPLYVLNSIIFYSYKKTRCLALADNTRAKTNPYRPAQNVQYWLGFDHVQNFTEI